MSEVPDILRRICEQRRRRVPPVPRKPGGFRLGGTGVPRASGAASPPLSSDAPGRRFLGAISARRGRAVIAEIKMGSPKLGDLRGRFDPVARAAAYAAAGAACLSVVVEPDHFYGSYELLAECAAASGLPAVAKDFVVSDVQLEWARDAGASAVLLIAALHDAAELRRLAALARGLGLVPLIETHDDEDFEKLAPLGTRVARSVRHSERPVLGGGTDRATREPVRAPVIGRSEGTRASCPHPDPTVGGRGTPEWQLVGINNRDLRTFEVDLERSADRVGRLPASALKVAESGIHSAADVARLRRAGFDAFLIGERLVLSGDPAAALAELLGDPATSGATP